ncbi:MAG TPA: S-adenosylmethionine:tRNA ribosyltransferase-isomerase [Paludibacteraceae bacterium]|nr:S-adenosylmethionine:tRNA ribosyltransferase-isomerase [Paludibacteraceae bacterium]HOS36928.1 S-adenosylmethionine:tRNA ribosyltransferase-isomerase [Paludibacteraceae bacterium]HPD27331.1 S-adenosylmethionine:tRNA ribosyltransferase-isomerase [Paludibacteraceae bacterium]HPK19910.1 S-adenosylmethionine:tRNA ribosyltransferase-isomerase [Paludibacteraceae bacterium]HRR58814.1 S-adenosylmethionine:tRNA ribosyltransferase-isomerase [Paludibacteraceae bacterium]
MIPEEIPISNYDYPLPDSRIAKFPLRQRDASKLLIWNKGSISERHFYDIPELLDSDDLLVYNNTRVIQARLVFYKSTGARIEIFCLEPHTPNDYQLIFQTTHQCVWTCLVGNLKKWKNGKLTNSVSINGETTTIEIERLHTENEMSHQIAFTWNNDNATFADILEQLGELPIPPYLNRKTEESDKTTYQTVYSKIKGSVAAPTAGLHFTQDVLNKIATKGVEREEITLHVGAGTFKPVKSAVIGQHEMHTEFFSIRKSSLERIIANLGHIAAVGTTSVRTLESLYYLGCNLHNKKTDFCVAQWQPYKELNTLTAQEALQEIANYMAKNNLTYINAATQIIIAPGFQFRIVNKMITNFHQPKSTLLLLISAFVENDNWKNIYRYALDNEFRFLSYGDSSLLIK